LSKYNAIKNFIDGHWFDSKKESFRYDELKLLQRAGQIKDLQIQPEFILMDGYRKDGKTVKAIKYIGDFSYIEDDHLVVEDVKGMKTPVYLLKKKLLLHRYPEIDFREI